MQYHVPRYAVLESYPALPAPVLADGVFPVAQHHLEVDMVLEEHLICMAGHGQGMHGSGGLVEWNTFACMYGTGCDAARSPHSRPMPWYRTGCLPIEERLMWCGVCGPELWAML